ncbi:VaFE repeat-containing surface-anchored protein [uncultured Varibaculum sp.]|uniref:VaFE repeat-containing surface-anchored protein n=1 Tax=uncultured Varibaculum sp. TaxID=413896 RepID=UPI00288B7203|nr:VaFE repeat-containing surface-anchored protein [uncultured Varibaculum sp.]
MIQKVSKRLVLLAALVALALSVIVPLSAPKAESKPSGAGYWAPNFGAIDANGKHWMGAHIDPKNPSKLVWCIELGPKPIDPGMTVSIETLSDAQGMTNYGGGDVDLTSLAQVAYLLNKYEKVDTADSRAALSMIMHFNLEVNKKGAKDEMFRLLGWINKTHPNTAKLVRQYVAEARNSGVSGYQSIGHTGDNKTIGNVHGIGVKNSAGKFIAGVPFTATLNGPAVFSATGKNTFSGKTAAKAITLDWRATGNGKVTGKINFTLHHSVNRLTGPGGRQRMVGRGFDPTAKTIPGGSWQVIYDFQPIATSKVEKPVVETGETTITDSLTAKADPKYANPAWLKDVKVKYEADVYYMGETLPTKGMKIPEGAKPVANTSLTFSAPGTQKASVNVDKPGFYTWVWKVVKKNQAVPERIHADWTDGYALPDEFQSKKKTAKITSAKNIINVHAESDAKTFINDWVKVADFPENHPDFKGWGGVKADLGTIDQHLYCVPDKTKLTEGVTRSLKPVKSWTIPAKNGDYRIADYFPDAPGEHIQDIDCRGVMVFVSEFAGDDRVEPLRTSDLDPKESFRPDHPTIHTMATDKADGDKYLPIKGNVTITDKVKYTELAAGKEYTLKATLMDKATGKPFQDCGESQVKDYSKAIASQLDGFEDKLKKDSKTTFDVKTALSGILPKVSETELDKAIATLDKDKVAGLVKDGKFDYDEAGKVLSKLVVSLDKPAEGKDCKPVTAEKTFTPNHRNGVVEIDIPVKAELLRGKTTVVFEDVLREGKEPIVHHDLGDKDQTVYSPDAKTTATDGKDGDKTVLDGRVHINDTVEYHSLKPGETYTLVGTMMDKETGKKVDCMGAKPVTFKADKSGNGKVKMAFYGNCSVAANTQWVVFEDIYTGKTPKGTHVVEHHDINDIDQTVTVIKAGGAGLAVTGATGLIALGASLMLVIAGGAVALYRRKMVMN